MKRSQWAALALSVTFIIGATAEAGERHWTVTVVTGEAQVSTGFETRSLVAGMRINPTDTIRTGDTGRVMLERDKNTIAAYENSRFQVRAPQRDSILTRVIQDVGELLFDVESREGRDFEVETPYLVVGVKGTTFGVEVDNGDAAVSVVGGLIEVADPATGEEVKVAAGETAQSDAAGGVQLVDQADTSKKWHERALQVSAAEDVEGPRASGPADRGQERRSMKAGLTPGNAFGQHNGNGNGGGSSNGNGNGGGNGSGGGKGNGKN